MWLISRNGFKEMVQENFDVCTRILFKKETFPG
jgi:hypothetical protein